MMKTEAVPEQGNGKIANTFPRVVQAIETSAATEAKETEQGIDAPTGGIGAVSYWRKGRLGMKINNKKALIIVVTLITMSLATFQVNRLAAQTPASPSAASALSLDDEKKMPEVEKYKAEIRKLNQDNKDHELSVDRLTAEIDKLRNDRYIAWGSTGAIILSFFGVIATILFQRKTSLDVQSRSEQTNFELKVADLIMSSYSGAAAKQRLNVLTKLYGDRLRPGFGDDFQQKLFPSIKYQELRLALFTALVDKCNTHDDVLEVFKQVFPEESDWWFDKLFPSKIEHKELVQSGAAVELAGANARDG